MGLDNLSVDTAAAQNPAQRRSFFSLGFTVPFDSVVSRRMADVFLQVSSELRAETDRGAIILAFAWIDEELTRSLKKFFRPSAHAAGKADELFGAGRPLGDAATKIDVAFRLGLLQEDTYKSLHLLRRLRNDFAHLAPHLTLETDSVRDRVRTLFELQKDMIDAILQTVREVPSAQELLKAHETKPSPQALIAAIGTKPVFAMLSGAIVSGLILMTSQVTPVTHSVQPCEA